MLQVPQLYFKQFWRLSTNNERARLASSGWLLVNGLN